MSLAIDVDKITGVLMADGWHEVTKRQDGKSSFCMDAYEYLWYRGPDRHDPELCLGGGAEPLIPATGACWSEKGDITVFCPMNAILAVRYGGSKGRKDR